jgi:hypothetical protein
MIYGEKFVWGHLPKTGGTSTASMFLSVPGLVEWYDNHDPLPPRAKLTPPQHLDFSQASTKLNIDFSNKKRILNIRRLPIWLLSHWQHRTIYRKEPFGSAQKKKLCSGLIHSHPSSTADGALQTWEYDKVDYWIRCDFLADDFIKVIDNFIEISDINKRKIKKIRNNVNVYPRKIRSWFTQEDLDKIYSVNPVWTQLEEELYGDLVTLND